MAAFPSLRALPRPFVVGVVVEDADEAVVPAITAVADAGCQAAEVNLTALPTAGTCPWSTRELVELPVAVYTSARRRAFMAAYGLSSSTLPIVDDATRMRWQIDLVGHGSVAVDLELDTFAPDPAPAPGSAAAASLAAQQGPPRELTRNRRAVAQQRSVIADVHDRGGEVIASCHTGTRQTADDLLAIVATAAERGADLVKVVAPCPTVDDLAELFRATARAYDLGAVPFTFVGAGACGALSRFVGPHLGSGWVFARSPGSSWSFADQPLPGDLRQVLETIPWRYAGVPT